MKKADNFDAKQWLVENKITTQSKLNENNTEASELLSLLASPEIKKYMDKLADTLEDADFMQVKKLYDGLYTELKKHE